MKKSMIRIAPVLLLALFALAAGTASAQIQSTKIAGSYWIDILPDGAPAPISGLLVLTADGRIMAWEQMPFEGGGYGPYQNPLDEDRLSGRSPA